MPKNLSLLSEILKFSAKNGLLLEGRQLHSHLIKLGCRYHQSLQNQLLNLYMKCGALLDACYVLDKMPERNAVSWNVMISGSIGFTPVSGLNISQIAPCNTKMSVFGRYERDVKMLVGQTVEEILTLCDFSGENMALLFFKTMLVDRVLPNHITLISCLRACSELNDVGFGRQMHCFIIKSGFCFNGFVGSALVDFYAKCCSVGDAHRAFDEIKFRDLVFWNVMVSCYALNDLGEKAFRIFSSMRIEGLMGDDFTFSSLLNSCGTLSSCDLGKQVHCLIIRLSLDSDVLVASALVDMYAKNGNIIEARKAFDVMVARNVVSWTTMIVGYGKNGEGKEAMGIFRQMLREGMKPDDLTLASLLSSCGDLAAATEAIQVHAHVTKSGLNDFLSIGNSLITAYSKCGCIDSAFKSFGSITKPNLVTWTSMISACAQHGPPRKSLEIFEKMLSEGTKPDRITFVGVLAACSHAGLVDEGLHYFDLMQRVYQIGPDSEHYSCLIGLLGRAGQINEAYEVLISMPFDPGANVYGAFISSCKVHSNTRLAEWAGEKLFKLEPKEPVNYAIMSNIYAAEGCWSEVAKVRRTMRERTSYKVPGCSWTEIGGQVQTFVSSDKSHPQSPEMYSMLATLFKLTTDEITCLM